MAATLNLPAAEFSAATLAVSVQSRTARDGVEECVTVRSGVRTMLTTDKPLYQPGQTIHLPRPGLARAPP